MQNICCRSNEKFARLKNAEEMYQMLYTTMHSNIYYKSMMTDHNTTGEFVFCTDTSLATIGIINEALLYSDETCIEVLPALPVQWKRGRIGGLMARCKTEVKELSWDRDEKHVFVTLLSSKDQQITVRCGVSRSFENNVTLKKGEPVTLTISI